MREVYGLLDYSRLTIAELAKILARKDSLQPEEIHMLQSDRRQGAAELLRRFERRKELERAEQKRLQKMLAEENKLWQQGYKHVAGVDEAGRGPLAGPVVAAAVIFYPGTVIPGINDSKKMSARKREQLTDLIEEKAAATAVGIATREDIDRLNIHVASMLAMRRALESMALEPDYVLVDGFLIRTYPKKQRAIKGGDALSISIAAASILAKVTRDCLMLDIHDSFPHYGFSQNKGYGTAGHISALNRYGPCPEHRRSFRLEY